MPTALLSVAEISKYFGGLVALDGVSLELAAGQVLCLIGPNGSGKTTLFNIISGLLGADQGVVRYKGVEIQNQVAHQIAALGIGRTFQSARLFPNLTILQNIELPQHARSRATVLDVLLCRRRERAERRAVRDRAERLLGEVAEGRLYPRRFDYPNTCSLGEQRILELIRVLALEPELILMDEPTQGLNPVWIREMLEIVEEIRSRGKTILLIEHKMSVVMRLSDQVVVLNSGRKIAEGTPEQVRTNPVVIEAYLGDRAP